MTKPSKDQIAELLKVKYGLNDAHVADVLKYAYSLSENRSKANDYAIAKEMNTQVINILTIVASAPVLLSTHNAELSPLNRSYILLANELSSLYERNPELNAITPGPIWKQFDVLEDNMWNINSYRNQTEGDLGEWHNARVNQLCIINGKEKADFTERQQAILRDSLASFHSIEILKEKNNSDKNERDWLIPEYKLTFEDEKWLKVNDILIKKTSAGSAIDNLLYEAFKHDGMGKFSPSSGNTRKLTSNVADIFAGKVFTKDEQKALKTIFFQSVSDKTHSISFKSTVTRSEADKTPNLDTDQLDDTLHKLGSETKRKKFGLFPDDIPF